MLQQKSSEIKYFLCLTLKNKRCLRENQILFKRVYFLRKQSLKQDNLTLII